MGARHAIVQGRMDRGAGGIGPRHVTSTRDVRPLKRGSQVPPNNEMQRTAPGQSKRRR
jgi:hypothetical protein